MWITFLTLLNVIEPSLRTNNWSSWIRWKFIESQKRPKFKRQKKSRKYSYLHCWYHQASTIELLAIRNNNKIRFQLTRYNIYRHKTSYISVVNKCIENIVNIEREYRMAFPILLLAHSMGWHIFAVVCANNIPRTNKKKRNKNTDLSIRAGATETDPDRVRDENTKRIKISI